MSDGFGFTAQGGRKTEARGVSEVQPFHCLGQPVKAHYATPADLPFDARFLRISFCAGK